VLTIPPEDTYPTVANGGSVTGSKDAKIQFVFANFANFAFKDLPFSGVGLRLLSHDV
jgi:hypothetical protein